MVAATKASTAKYRRLAAQGAVALAMIAVGSFAYFMMRGTAELHTARDALAYWAAAHHAWAGAPLYDRLAPGPHEFRGHWPYLYPPPLAALLALVLGQGQWWGESLKGLRYHFTPEAIWGNVSLSFAPVQVAVLKGWWPYREGPLPGAVRAYLIIFSIAVPLLVLFAARRLSPVMQAALAAMAATLAVPIVRPYALSVVLVPLAVWLGERRSRPRVGRDTAGCREPGAGGVPAAAPESAAATSPDAGVAP